MRLKDKVVVVTGAGRNIGKALCLAFAREGADVVINVRSQRDEGEAVAREVETFGRQAIVVLGDVSRKDEVVSMRDATLEAFGKVDVLVNNAGIRPHSHFLEMGDEEWASVIAVNLNGPYHCCKAFVPLMTKQRSGCIINVSGRSGFVGHKNRAHVVASKAGLHGLTKGLAHDLGEYGIRVNTLVPSSLGDTSREEDRTEEQRQVLKEIPLRRHSTVDDVAKVAVFLASDEAGFITGQALHINGGKYML